MGIETLKDRSNRRRAVLVAVDGWLLLIVGLAILRLDASPQWLETLGEWLQPFASDLHIDAPMPLGLWLSGILLLLAGMVLVGYAETNLVDLQGKPSLSLRPPRPARVLPLPRRWLALVIVSNAVWIGVVIAAARGSTHWTIIPLWMTAMALQGVCWWRADHLAIPGLRISVRWLWAIGLAVALCIVLFRLGEVPNSIWGDEGAFWAVARDLAAGAQVNPFAMGVYRAYPLMGSLYQSLWLRAFGSTLWSWRLGSAVIGTLTIVPLFFLVRRLLGPRVAWSAAVLMIGLPYFLAFTRMGYNNIQPVLPVTTGLWLIVEALHSQSRGLAYLAGVAFGIASLTYTAGHVGLVLALSLLLYFLLSIRGMPSRRLIAELALCVGIGWLYAAGPCFLGGTLSGNLLGGKGAESFFGSAFYGEALFSRDELTRLYPLWQIGQHRVFFEPRLYALLLVRGVLRTGLGMVADRVAVQHYLVGPLAGPGVVFFLAGFAWALRRFRQRRAALWVMWTLVCALLLSVLNTFPPRATHLVPIIPALVTLTAVGVWLLNSQLRAVLRSPWADSIAVALTLVLALVGLRAYFVTMPQRYTPDLQNVMFWRAQEMEEGSHLVFVVDAPYPSDFTVQDIDEFNLGVDYRSVPADKVDTTDFRALCGNLDVQQSAACRVFFLADENADTVKAELRRQLGRGKVQRHTDAYGATIGLEFIPKSSGAHPKLEPGRSDLRWNGLLVAGVLIAILLSPLPVRAWSVKLISHVCAGTTAVKHKAASLRASWTRRMMPSLFFGCLICGILGQVYFARDFVPGRKEYGPHFWPGVVFYALSIAYFLLLTETTKSSLTGGLSTFSSPSQPPFGPPKPWRSLLGQDRWRIGLLCVTGVTGLTLVWDLRHRSADAGFALPFVLWILMMVAYLVTFLRFPSRIWKTGHRDRVLEWWRAHSVELLAVLVLTAVAFALRVCAVDSIPSSLGEHKAPQGPRAIESSEAPHTSLFGISEWPFSPNFGTFSAASALAVVGRTVTGLRILGVLVGTASVLMTYVLTRQLLGKQAALVSGFFLAAQHYHLHFSRLGSSNTLDTLSAPLLAFLLLRGLQSQRAGWFAAAGLTLGVAQYSGSGTIILPLLVMAVACGLALTRRALLQANLVNLGILVLGAALALLPMALFKIGHPGAFLGRVSQASVFHPGWLVNEMQQSGKSVLEILGNAFLRSSLAFNYFTDQSFWYRPSIPFLDPVSAVLFVLGLTAAVRYAPRNPGYLLVTAWFWLAVILGGTLTMLSPASERLVITTPALSVLVTLGLLSLVEHGKTLMMRSALLSRFLPYMIPVVTLALMLINTGYYFAVYTPSHVYGNPTSDVVTWLLQESVK